GVRDPWGGPPDEASSSRRRAAPATEIGDERETDREHPSMGRTGPSPSRDLAATRSHRRPEGSPSSSPRSAGWVLRLEDQVEYLPDPAVGADRVAERLLPAAPRRVDRPAHRRRSRGPCVKAGPDPLAPEGLPPDEVDANEPFPKIIQNQKIF